MGSRVSSHLSWPCLRHCHKSAMWYSCHVEAENVPCSIGNWLSVATLALFIFCLSQGLTEVNGGEGFKLT